jgi:ribonuclease D
MRGTSHQTIRLGRGRHTSPESGACVMELTSMLAGEAFSDRPQSACPVISSFLRAYNDRVNDERRQDLYRYAAEAVGSRSSRRVEQARAERLAAWGRDMWARRWTRRFAPRSWRLVGVERQPPHDLLGVHATRAIRRVDDRTHAAAMALIDELLAIRDEAGSLPLEACEAPERSVAEDEGVAVTVGDQLAHARENQPMVARGLLQDRFAVEERNRTA